MFAVLQGLPAWSSPFPFKFGKKMFPSKTTLNDGEISRRVVDFKLTILVEVRFLNATPPNGMAKASKFQTEVERKTAVVTRLSDVIIRELSSPFVPNWSYNITTWHTWRPLDKYNFSVESTNYGACSFSAETPFNGLSIQLRYFASNSIIVHEFRIDR